MSSKVIIIGAIVTLALLFGGLFFLSRPQPKVAVNPQATGQLTAGESFYDFGSVSMAKGAWPHCHSCFVCTDRAWSVCRGRGHF
ncbi:MAG: hypothetical protein UY06_C0017G0007 [Candidatus Amesbacteria bacterium GW2011_GWA2_47_70]|nr:MAG: hypothetical protein UY06_C0017G0007 [Candidatus Amesbacteria bacterium GW2011_GWA2_47_70]